MTHWFYRAVGTVGIASGICLLGTGAAQADDLDEALPATDPQPFGSLTELLTPLGGSLDPTDAVRGAPADDTVAVVGDLTGTATDTVSDLRVGNFKLFQMSRDGSTMADIPPALRGGTEGLPAVGGLPVVGSLLGGAGGDRGGMAGPLGGLSGLPVIGGLVPGGAAVGPDAPQTLPAPVSSARGAGARPAPARHAGERPVAGEDSEYSESTRSAAIEDLPAIGILSQLPLLGSLGALPAAKQTPAISQLPVPMDALRSVPLAG